MFIIAIELTKFFKDFVNYPKFASQLYYIEIYPPTTNINLSISKKIIN